MITIVLIILLMCTCGDCAAQSRDAHLEQVANTTDNGNDDFAEFVRLSQMAQQNGDISQAIEYAISLRLSNMPNAPNKYSMTIICRKMKTIVVSS